MTRWIARAEAGVLLAWGGLALWLSMADAYARLMRPEFRPLTAVCGVLVIAMGAALVVRPRAHPRVTPTIVLGLFAALAVAATGGARNASLIVVPEVGADEVRREGYESIEAARFTESDVTIADGARVAVTGFAHRTDALDAEGRYVLLAPRMTCCVADALALGVIVDAVGAPAPEQDEWVTVFGTARRAAQPLETPPFRVGPILFTVVGESHLLVADEAVPVRALLPDVVGLVPPDRCSVFLTALESTGVARELQGAGPFTLLCPLDDSFSEAAARADGDLGSLVRRHVVMGDFTEASLYGVDALRSLGGGTLRLEAENGRVRIEGARLLFGDLRARNGMVHIVHPALVR